MTDAYMSPEELLGIDNVDRFASGTGIFIFYTFDY
jgi:hypothetical protein